MAGPAPSAGTGLRVLPGDLGGGDLPGRKPAAGATAGRRWPRPPAPVGQAAGGRPGEVQRQPRWRSNAPSRPRLTWTPAGCGQLAHGPHLALPGGLTQQLLDRAEIMVAEPGWAASSGPIRQRVQPTGHHPPQRPPHGGLADRQLLGDLGHGLALVAELHALQADPQARQE